MYYANFELFLAILLHIASWNSRHNTGHKITVPPPSHYCTGSRCRRRLQGLHFALKFVSSLASFVPCWLWAYWRGWCAILESCYILKIISSISILLNNPCDLKKMKIIWYKIGNSTLTHSRTFHPSQPSSSGGKTVKVHSQLNYACGEKCIHFRVPRWQEGTIKHPRPTHSRIWKKKSWLRE